MPKGKKMFDRPSAIDVEFHKDLLRPTHHQALNLWATGMGRKEIAELLQIPVGTVKSRVHRASHNLNKILEVEKAKEIAQGTA